jgi:hypothetical protein
VLGLMTEINARLKREIEAMHEADLHMAGSEIREFEIEVIPENELGHGVRKD